MATTIPIYETERGNEGGDVKHVPEVDDLNAVIDRINAIQAAVNLSIASVATGVVGDNNAIRWTAKAAGADGNSISVALVVSGNSTPLSVAVSGKDITVHVATGVGGAATSTATQVRTAVAASAPADALVTVTNEDTSDGTGVVAAVGQTHLSGGEGTAATPLAHVTAP